MIKILLVTAGGMSTSLLVTKMRIEAQNQGIEVDIITEREKNIEGLIGKFDVLLLGPEVHGALNTIEELCHGQYPITVIDIKDYGMMNGKNVLNTALKMYNEFYKL